MGFQEMSGFRVWGLGFTVWGLGFGVGVYGLGLVQGMQQVGRMQVVCSF